MELDVHVLASINEVNPDEWDAMVEDHNPFLSHAFLAAMETYHSVGEQFGWQVHHVVLKRNQLLVAACPLYLKNNSYGEFVFDWAWADAYQRYGLHYYPKLVSALPYTPATSQRLLVKPGEDIRPIRSQLVQAVLALAAEQSCSSLHWLFPLEEEHRQLMEINLIERLDCQYHWLNRDYQDFDHYLSFLNSRKRKKIKRERRFVLEQNIKIERYYGHQMTASQWQQWHTFYADTFYRKSGYPTFSLDFFRHIGEQLKHQVVIFFAYLDQQTIAASLSYQSDTTLYGRHWGCLAEYNSLHFELCYYQGIEYCIAQRLKRFEPGAQGEHKIHRGFLPTVTRSAHWIAHTEFSQIIRRYCEEEKHLMLQRIEQLRHHSPFRHTNECVPLATNEEAPAKF